MLSKRQFSVSARLALEAATVIGAQDLAGTGVTVNALLPGGAMLTGMISESVDPAVKATLLDPAIVVPPLLRLASAETDGLTGIRFDAACWDAGQCRAEAA